MAAWGTDHFANDDAMDWIADLESATDASVLREAIAPVLTDADYIEAPVGSVALAAAEVVAALRGKPRSDLPPEVVSWVEAFGTLNDGPLLENARKAVAIVGEDGARSELRQLWDEADVDDATAWRQAVADLRKRLT